MALFILASAVDISESVSKDLTVMDNIVLLVEEYPHSLCIKKNSGWSASTALTTFCASVVASVTMGRSTLISIAPFVKLGCLNALTILSYALFISALNFVLQYGLAAFGIVADGTGVGLGVGVGFGVDVGVGLGVAVGTGALVESGVTVGSGSLVGSGSPVVADSPVATFSLVGAGEAVVTGRVSSGVTAAVSVTAGSVASGAKEISCFAVLLGLGSSVCAVAVLSAVGETLHPQAASKSRATSKSALTLIHIFI